MFSLFRKSITTGKKTTEYPYKKENTPANLMGRLVIDQKTCNLCGQCATICPTKAIKERGQKLIVEYDKCLFCGICRGYCPLNAISHSTDFELAVREKDKLTVAPADINEDLDALKGKLTRKTESILGRSLHIRHVDTGSCNGCDFEMNALTNPVYDIQRLGIDFVASPRHADLLLVTGSVTEHLETALKKTFAATPEPKLVVAMGACACSGGIFQGSYANAGGVDKILPVDVFIPGCPPRPQAIIYGLLKAIERIK
ncbi:MAG TPA: NADH-quinone oxidoreductase subunit NuoB [Desulfobacteria bacterium]|nr:NADH-quinone oxidoreductase subunit NuoB [Desulfobacteria bacterium]